MSEVKELVSKYRWWLLGAVVVVLVLLNNKGVADARATSTDASMMETTTTDS